MFYLRVKILTIVIILLLGVFDSYSQRHKRPPKGHKPPKHLKPHNDRHHPQKEKALVSFLSRNQKELDGSYDSISYYLNAEKTDKALAIANRLKAHGKREDNPVVLSLAHHYLGIIYHHSGMVYLATENYLKCLDLSDKNNLELNLMEVCLHLSKINIDLKDKKNNDKILEYLKPKLNTFDELRKDIQVNGIIGETYLSNALICKEFKDDFCYENSLDSAEYYFNEAKKLNPDVGFIGIDELKYERGFYRELIPSLKERLNFLQEDNSPLVNQIFNKLVSCYLNINETDSAYLYLDHIVKNLKKDNLPGQVTNSLLASKIYKQKGDLDSANFYLNQAFEFKNMLDNEKTTKLTNELNIKYQSEKKDLLLENQKHLLSRQKHTIFLLVVGSLFILLVLILIYKNYLFKKKSNIELTLKNQTILEQSQQLEQLSTFKESLTSMIVHDLKNPINAVIGLSGKGNLKDDKFRVINNSGKNMMNLVLNILDVQKFEETKFELLVSNISSKELIEKAILETKYLLKEKNIKLKTLIEADYVLNIDFDLIQRVLINLISNAVKYSKFNNTIEITINKIDGSFINISIKDYGNGIPADQITNIFDKFWQFKSKKSSGVRSVGLGLTFCKMAIEAHGGTIKAKSEEGEWTEISFTLPYDNATVLVKEIKDNLFEDKTENQILLLTDFQKSYLSSYANEMSVFQPYETTDILNVLYCIMKTDPMIIKWKEEIENSVISGNTGRFEELLEMIDSKIEIKEYS